MAMTTAKYQLIEERLGTDLARRLRQLHQAGISNEAIARLLTIEAGVPVVGETVRQWMRRLPPVNGGEAVA